VSIDRIEIGRVFADRDKPHRVVRITELKDVSNPLHGVQSIPSVSFEIWDTHDLDVPWSNSSLTSREGFEAHYRYVPDHVLNTQAELDEAQKMLNHASRTITAVVATAIGVKGAVRVVDLLVNVARREAALRIAAHEWDEGCAAGCCDDSRGAEKAAELIMVTFTEAERAEMLNQTD
jgi:hypothetical protein